MHVVAFAFEIGRFGTGRRDRSYLHPADDFKYKDIKEHSEFESLIIELTLLSHFQFFQFMFAKDCREIKILPSYAPVLSHRTFSTEHTLTSGPRYLAIFSSFLHILQRD